MSKSNIASLAQRAGQKPQPIQQPIPDNAALSGARLAAHNRKLNEAIRAGQSVPGQPVQFAPDLVITESAIGFSVHLALPDGAECPVGQEAALAWSIQSTLTDGKSLTGHETVRISLLDADSSQLAAAAGLIGRLDAVLQAARADSEDESLAHTVQTIAAHYRVKRIVLASPDGSQSEIRRGESYIKAHRMVDAFMARSKAA